MPNTLIRSGYLDSDRTCSLSDAADRFYFRSHLACDDAGRLDGRPDVLVSELFKAQNRAKFTAAKAEKCIAECVENGLYHPYVWDGKPYLQVTRYHRRSPSTRSKYPWVDGSYTIEYEKAETRDGLKEFVKTSLPKYHGNGDGCRMGAGTHADGCPMGPSRAIDGDGDDLLVASNEATLSANADPPTLANFAAAWNEHVQVQRKGPGTKVGTMREDLAGDSRRKHWASRVKEPEFVANWRAILDKAFASDFLNGRARSGRDWSMSPDWLLRNNDNYRKVLEGKYDNRPAVQQPAAPEPPAKPLTKSFTICRRCRQAMYDCECEPAHRGKHNTSVQIPADAEGARALGLAREAIERHQRRTTL